MPLDQGTTPAGPPGVADAGPNRSPAFDAVLDAWRGVKGERRWPSRHRISAATFDPHHLPGLFLVDVLSAAPLRVRYRLVGTRLAGMLGRDPTGRTLDEMPFLFRWFAKRAYTKLLRRQEPCFDRVTVLEGTWPIRYDRLLLPLGEDDTGIDAVLGMIAGLTDDLPARPVPYLRR